MSEMVNKNLEIVNELCKYPNLRPFLTYQDNNLYVSCEGVTLSFDLTKVDFSQIYNEKFKESLNLMNIQALAKILEIENKKEKILGGERINFDKYIFLIKNEGQRLAEVEEFESFMKDALQYQNYIARDLENVVLQYVNYMNLLENNPNITLGEVEAVKVYKKIRGRDTLVRHTIAEEYAKRGFSFIYFLLASLGVIFIATILLMVKSL